MNMEAAMIDNIDILERTDYRMINPESAAKRKRGRPKTSDLNRSEQVRLANLRARHNQRAAKEELLTLLMSMFRNPKSNIFEKNREPQINVPAKKLAKAILLAADLGADEINYDIVIIINKLKSSGEGTKQDLVKAIKDSKPAS